MVSGAKGFEAFGRISPEKGRSTASGASHGARRQEGQLASWHGAMEQLQNLLDVRASPRRAKL